MSAGILRWRGVAWGTGRCLLVLAAAMLAPLLLAFRGADAGLFPLGASLLLTLALGLLLSLAFPRLEDSLSRREGIALLISVALASALLGAFPFFFSPFFRDFSGACFESISGFTTTGATLLRHPETLPPSLLLWRALTQWLGGLGAILLGVALLPLVGVGGVELYRARFSGCRSENLGPRLRETTASLGVIYLGLTGAAYLGLRWAGMGNFDALCHAFSAVSTGGFSTRAGSIGSFASARVEGVIILVMLLSGMSFVRHYQFLFERRPAALWRDEEAWGMLALVLGATVALFFYVRPPAGAGGALRLCLFQATSVVTTTGFVTTDFARWAPFPRLLLLGLILVGASTGSTGGGLKVSRLGLLLKLAAREFRRMVERHGVFTVRYSGKAIQEETLAGLLNLLYLAFLINVAACLVLTALGVDVLSAISAVAASMFNVGPAMGHLGPLETYASLGTPARWTLAFCMLAGRLEFYALIVIFTPAFWKK